MATGFARLASISASRLLLSAPRTKSNTLIVPVRTIVCTETGALLQKPAHCRLGLIKVALVVVPFVTAGGMLSREVAGYLEDNEIFVYEDDDD